MSNEKRNSQRVNLEAPIKITKDDQSSIIVHSYDFSDTGLFVDLEGHQIDEFPLNTHVTVQYQELTYEAPKIAGLVVRHSAGGMGIKLEKH